MNTDPGLFDEILARGRVREAVSDRAWLDAMRGVEAALARAQADAGQIPPEHARVIEEACLTGEFDLVRLAREAAEHGNPVLPLVNRLRELVPGDVSASVHKGATSQDILDTAAMMVAQDALDEILSELDGAVEAAVRLAREHRATPMPGRTLMQRAEPMTFGSAAAQWLAGLDDARQWLRRVRQTRIVAQFGGAVGLLSGYEMILKNPPMSWHGNRVGVAEIACALGTLSGVVAKVAGDVVLLAQTEVGEVSEGRPGGSSCLLRQGG